MTGEIENRIHEWLPADLTDPAEIRQALEGTGWVQEWGPGTLDRVVNGIDSRRDIETPESMREKRRREQPMGSERVPMVRAADGSLLGKPENVRTWEDAHGNIVGQNTNTGRRTKVTDSDDRE